MENAEQEGLRLISNLEELDASLELGDETRVPEVREKLRKLIDTATPALLQFFIRATGLCVVEAARGSQK